MVTQHYSSSSGDELSSPAASREEDTSTSSSVQTSSHHSRFQSPIVAKLWEARRESNKYRSKAIFGDDTGWFGIGPQDLKGRKSSQDIEDEPSFKHPKDSLFDATYPFTSDEYLREAYKSPGGTMRFGKVC